MLEEMTPESTSRLGIHPSLPGRDYHDPAVYEVERERVFHRNWFCVGRDEQIPESGDYLTGDVAGEGVLVTRAKSGELHAFYNVCRHRGSVLCGEAAGRTKGAIVCPYHNWTYAMDGDLIGTPNVHENDGLDRSAFGLRRIHLDTWDGFVFVNLADDPRPLLDQLSVEPDGPLSYARYRTGELRIGAHVAYEVEANWKIVIDNFNECLHCPSVHPELTAIVPIYRKGIVLDDERGDGGVTLAEGTYTFATDGVSKLPMLPDLGEIDCRTYYGYSVFPNLLVNLLSTGVMVYTLFPTGSAHTTVVSEYLYRPETIAAEGFDPSDMVEFLDLVSRQDWSVCERAQRGVGSKGFVQGVYPPQDYLLHLFAERYLEERGPIP